MFYGRKKKNAMNELCNNDLLILLFNNDFKRFTKKNRAIKFLNQNLLIQMSQLLMKSLTLNF